jgi:hypothetical protein
LLARGAALLTRQSDDLGSFSVKFEIIVTSKTEPELDVLIAFAKQHDLKFIGIIEEEQEEDDRV